jgi:hypothetical protein
MLGGDKRRIWVAVARSGRCSGWEVSSSSFGRDPSTAKSRLATLDVTCYQALPTSRIAGGKEQEFHPSLCVGGLNIGCRHEIGQGDESFYGTFIRHEHAKHRGSSHPTNRRE